MSSRNFFFIVICNCPDNFNKDKKRSQTNHTRSDVKAGETYALLDFNTEEQGSGEAVRVHMSMWVAGCWC